jgi:transcriptional regulator with XRE-family HTH domain
MPYELESMKRGRDRVRRERIARGWSQAQLAGVLGLDGSTVRKWELGCGVLKLEHRVSLSAELNLSLRDLVSARELAMLERAAARLSA